MIDNNVVKQAIQEIEKASINKDLDLFCTSRDIFQSRLDTYINKTEKYMESAIIGEIGNNTFDHNWDYQDGHLRGTYFNSAFLSKFVLLADYGRGIRASLSRVLELRTDEEAVKDAFTKQVSGRAPEQRGNGLKFVSNTLIEKKWNLYFQSGIGCCIIQDGKMNFTIATDSVIGCLAILEF